MPTERSSKEKLIYVLYNIIFPMILLFYPLIKSGIGVDYMDSMYSLGNFVFFQEMEGTWVIATYLANVIGFALTKLPGAGTYLGLRIYTNLFVSAMALISYFWLKNRIKIPAWIVAAGEVIAIGLCWCPTTILYNYLTYFFMLISLICLYEGLVQDKKGLLVLAGVFLGANLLVRFPNVIEVGFILAVWTYGILKKKKIGKVVQETLWCMLGYFATVGILMGIIIAAYGINSYVDMIASLFSMTDAATSYKPIEMVVAIVRTYLQSMKWPIGMALYVLVVNVMFNIMRGRLLWAKRLATVLGILVLFRWYYGRGMFNVKYHTYESMFWWAATFLIIAIVIFILNLFDRKISPDYKLLCIILILVIGITPIGSNNNIYPNMNNLFLVAPIAMFSIYNLIIKVKDYEWAFPMQAMLTMVILALLVQSVGFGTTFVFRGARNGHKRDTQIINNVILKGMYTNAEKAEAIEGLSQYWDERNAAGVSEEMERTKVLLFGHIPGVSYFLNVPCAIPHSWPDLASYAYDTFENDMEELKGRITDKGEAKPVVIVSYGVNAVLTDDAEAMDYYVNNIESGEEPLERMLASDKLKYLGEFLQEFNYRQTFSNNRFVVYE